MKLIFENPYRILGLSNTATDREISKRVSNLSVYAEMGKAVNYDYDFVEFSPLERTIETIKDAERKLEQPRDKLLHSLFWISYSSSDKHLLQIKNNPSTEIIENIPENDVFDLHNKAIFTLFLKKEFKNIKQGVKYFNDFLIHPKYIDFERKILNARLTDSVKADEIFFDELFKEINSDFEAKKILDLIKNTPKEEQIKTKLVRPIIFEIETEIETSRNKTKAEPTNAYKYGKELIKSTSEKLTELKSILLVSDIKYTSISNKLAAQILNCSIAYFNKNFESAETNIGSNALELAEIAKQIAKSSVLKDRIEKNIPNIKVWVERITCFFCAKKKKTRKKIKIKLHKVTSRSQGSIRYKKIEIGVPRCLSCSIKHKLSYFYAFLLGSGLLGLITYLLLMVGEIGVGSLNVIGTLGFMFLLLFAYFFLLPFVYKFSYKVIIKYVIKIKSKKDISDYKPIHDLITMKSSEKGEWEKRLSLIDGWKIGAKPEF